MTTTAWMWLVLLTAIALSATVGLVVRFVQHSRAKRGKLDGS
jgi:type III secretory pathway component EscS